MSIRKIWFDQSEEECVTCGACECVCDAIFHVTFGENEIPTIKPNVDYAAYDEEIREAADLCPAGIIKYE